MRGYSDEADIERFFSPSYEDDLHDPYLFSQMAEVVEAIARARDAGETIGIFGDFDADGVTSSVIIREALSALDIPVAVYIPDKNSEGHGLNQKAVDFFSEKNIRLILTLDCGMTNHAEILSARDKGIATIVIDHHHVPPVMPAALAIINPKLKNETYPFKDLCGAGTSFKVAQALFQKLLPEKVDQLKWLLDVVATGTVADVMPLIGENRVFVKYGLIVLSKTRRVGFREMIGVGRLKIDEENLPDARALGFQIAPRINAASRMAHAMLAHDLLMTDDPDEARRLAGELENHNLARQKICGTVTDMVRAVAAEKYGKKKFIFSADSQYPFGIVGLIAGRIASEFRKPTCVLYRGETESQGSFRSIPGLNIIETLEECGDMLVKYGGHAQAAGMTIRNEHLESFYDKFNGLVEEKLAGIVTEPEIAIDFPLEPALLSPELSRDLARFAPFGEGNPEPIFSLEKVEVRDIRMVGNGQKHLKLTLGSATSPKTFDAIGFSLGNRFPDLKKGEVIDVAFTLSQNTWQGRTGLQLKLCDIRRPE